ncbi:MAG: RNA 2'-phosphotransferase [Eubacteriales bacterium]|nr:RNA 2'-phosphotransferase [Eubacteriales bacterium]
MNYKKTSKFLSMLLRHRPEVIGITLDKHGWADVDELIEKIGEKQEFGREILEEIVRTDEKQRYSFNEDGTKIRANQGHSITVDLELKAKEPPEMLWHGTAEKYVDSIDRMGLRPGNRMYVHLSLDEQTAEKVGRRHGRPVLYQVKSGEMYRKGFRFYQSANGIWLTLMVPVEYLKKV